MIEWETSYRIGSTPWLRRSANPALQHWFDGRDLTGQRMLVPGCGTSLEPALLAASGALVTCLDIAPSAIAAQRQAFEMAGYDGEFAICDLLSWQRDNHSFDLAYEQTCLCAVGRDQRHGYEASVWGALRPGGKLFALFMQTGGAGGPPFHCGLEEMRQIFTLERWDWPEAQPFRSDHPIGVHELGAVLTKRVLMPCHECWVEICLGVVIRSAFLLKGRLIALVGRSRHFAALQTIHRLSGRARLGRAVSPADLWVHNLLGLDI